MCQSQHCNSLPGRSLATAAARSGPSTNSVTEGDRVSAPRELPPMLVPRHFSAASCRVHARRISCGRMPGSRVSRRRASAVPSIRRAIASSWIDRRCTSMSTPTAPTALNAYRASEPECDMLKGSGGRLVKGLTRAPARFSPTSDRASRFPSLGRSGRRAAYVAADTDDQGHLACRAAPRLGAPPHGGAGAGCR